MAGPCRRVLAIFQPPLSRRVPWLVLGLACVSVVTSAAPPMLESRGPTMGTGYMVKLFDPPPTLPEDWKERVDGELRRVNDQMSTYLESSEVSRFNASDSTDWFEVSPETAQVVAKSLELHRLSDGAFEITVAPLVDAWSFGPGKRTLTPPTRERVAELLQRVGSQHLSVRDEPPAIRKARPEIAIDLSAIAKGHGVDRLIALITGWGVKNAFVEIGGEVRVTGDKAGEPWRVGIQQPDIAGEVVAKSLSLRDRAIATSGDYRNFFDFEGQRYSHTIDPRTGQPVRHATASVSVIADDCMTADAWATAINVLGPEEGARIVRELGLDVLLVVRQEDDTLASIGFGALSDQTSGSNAGTSPSAAGLAVVNATPGDAQGDVAGSRSPLGQWLRVGLLTAIAFGVALGAMAVGVMFGRRAISGSCGGLSNGPDGQGGGPCALCSKPAEACSRLREQQQAAEAAGRPG